MRDGKKIKLDIEKLIKRPNSKNNLILMNNDKIFIKEYTGIIEVIGEVNSPGFYSFKIGSRIKDVIEDSGGEAHKKG